LSHENPPPRGDIPKLLIPLPVTENTPICKGPLGGERVHAVAVGPTQAGGGGASNDPSRVCVKCRTCQIFLICLFRFRRREGEVVSDQEWGYPRPNPRFDGGGEGAPAGDRMAVLAADGAGGGGGGPGGRPPGRPVTSHRPLFRGSTPRSTALRRAVFLPLHLLDSFSASARPSLRDGWALALSLPLV